jgi:hypothetical protein
VAPFRTFTSVRNRARSLLHASVLGLMIIFFARPADGESEEVEPLFEVDDLGLLFVEAKSSRLQRPLAFGVRTRSPSMPAVLRPLLCCVTRFTLTSVLLRLLNMSFCTLRTF